MLIIYFTRIFMFTPMYIPSTHYPVHSIFNSQFHQQTPTPTLVNDTFISTCRFNDKCTRILHTHTISYAVFCLKKKINFLLAHFFLLKRSSVNRVLRQITA